MENLNVMNAPKTATFQMGINPEIKNQAEQLFQNCGMTLTDAINVFSQKAMNASGMPFIIALNSRGEIDGSGYCPSYERNSGGP